MIELRRLSAFVAVAEEGHVTRAAERLGMAQPPLSRIIAALEAELGVRLLHRLPRGVSLTPAGVALLDEARAVLARAASVRDVVSRAARGEQGRLAVGFTSSVAMHPFVPTALLQFRDAFPNIRTDLQENDNAELVEALLAGRLDAAFLRISVSGLADIQIDHLSDEPMLAALPSGHPLARASGQALPLSAFAAEPFVLYRRHSGPGLYDAILAACQETGFSPNVVQEAPRMPATLNLVAAGIGVSLVPASMRRMAVTGVTYRELVAPGRLVASLHLATRLAVVAPTAARFRAVVRDRAATFARENAGSRGPG